MLRLEVLLVLVAAMLPVLAGVRILNEHERGVVFRLGRFCQVLGPGLRWVLPGTDRMVRVDLPAFLPEWRSLTPAELETRLREAALSGEIRA